MDPKIGKCDPGSWILETETDTYFFVETGIAPIFIGGAARAHKILPQQRAEDFRQQSRFQLTASFPYKPSNMAAVHSEAACKP